MEGVADANMNELKDPALVSVVVVLRGEADGVGVKLGALAKGLSDVYSDFEIIAVLDSSNSKVKSDVEGCLDCVYGLRTIELARWSDFDSAAFSGIDGAIGDRVCLFDPWAESLDDLLRLMDFAAGFDVVQGVSSEDTRRFAPQWIFRRLFYTYCRRALGFDVPVMATHFVCLSRGAVGVISRSRTGRRFVRQEVRLASSRYAEFTYSPLSASLGRRSLRTGISEGIGILTNYSAHPLQAVARVALAASGISLIYALYVLLLYIVRRDVVPGWTTTSLMLAILFFVLTTLLAAIAAYLGAILDRLRDRTGYHILNERLSRVIDHRNGRRNIVS